MNIKKEIVKEGIKNQLKTLLHMIIFILISIVIWYLAFCDIKEIGIDRSGFFPSSQMKVNLYIAIPCFIAMLTLYSVFWNKFLKEDLKKSIKMHWLSVVIFALLYILFYLCEIFLLIFILIIQIGLFVNIENIPVFMFYFILAYPIGYSITEIIINRKKLKE